MLCFGRPYRVLRSSKFSCNGQFDLCPPHFQWQHTGTQLPLTQQHASPHQTIQTRPLQTGLHNLITIAKSSSPICSVMAMIDYLLQAQPPSSHPLFLFVQPRRWLTQNNLTTERRTILQHCGIPVTNFYSPSFRVGAATTAAKAALPPGPIKVFGFWSSDCYECCIWTPKCTF